MSLRPGTGAAYAGSLGEAIEGALAAELFALRSTLMPGAGKDDRKLLFAAIGQGVLQYLAVHHHDNVTVSFTGVIGAGDKLDVDFAVPTLTYSGGSVHGANFPSGTVTVRELREGGAGASVSVSIDGTFTTSVSGGAGTVVDARDGAGNAAQAVIT